MRLRISILRAGAFTLAALVGAVPPLRAQVFHKYVALGDSLTAAVEGGCIVERHQLHSYPKVVADQIGIADFQQPIVGEKVLSSPLTGNPCLGAVLSGSSISVGAISQMGSLKNATLARPYDNLGIAGANTADLVNLKVANPAGNTANKNAALVLRNFPGGPFEGKSAVDEANLLSPDLVTLWIGNNDVLGAALAGVAFDGVTLTPVAVFDAKYNEVIAGIKGSGRTLVVLNVPDVTAVPFATTIPRFVVNPATRQPVLINGAPVPLLGPGNASFPCSPVAPDTGCPLPAGTLVTLNASALLATGVGIPKALGGAGTPLPDGSVGATGLTQGVLLYPDEVSLIKQRTTDINAKIASIGSANGAILIDVNAIFNDIKANGFTVGGITVTADFLSGGIFSADGFHASNIGYALVADFIIKAINAAKNTDIPEPNLAQVLFAADVVTTSSIVPRGAGPFGYPLAAGVELLRLFPPVDESIAVIELESAGRAPRVVQDR